MHKLEPSSNTAMWNLVEVAFYHISEQWDWENDYLVVQHILLDRRHWIAVPYYWLDDKLTYIMNCSLFILFIFCVNEPQDNELGSKQKFQQLYKSCQLSGSRKNVGTSEYVVYFLMVFLYCFLNTQTYFILGKP